MSTIKSSAENLTLNADGSGNDVLIQSNGSTKAIVTAEGTLGIGTTAPLRQLHISNTSANPEIAFTSGTSGAASLLFGDGLTGTDVYKGYVQYQHNGDYMLIATGATTRLRVDSDGLKFNADTAAANALDDYEEGTWSPTLIGATFANQTTTGRYVKIGNIVHIQYYTAAFNISSASGAARISNLPYAPLNVSGHHSVINYAHGTAVTGAAHIYLDHSNATMYFVTNDTTSSASWTNGNSKYVMISGTYQTA